MAGWQYWMFGWDGPPPQEYAQTVTNTEGLLDPVEAALTVPLTKSDNLGLLDDTTVNYAAQPARTEVLGITDSLTLEVTRTISTNVGLLDGATAETVAAPLTVTVTDQLALTEAGLQITPSFRFRAAVGEVRLGSISGLRGSLSSQTLTQLERTLTSSLPIPSSSPVDYSLEGLNYTLQDLVGMSDTASGELIITRDVIDGLVIADRPILPLVVRSGHVRESRLRAPLDTLRQVGHELTDALGLTEIQVRELGTSLTEPVSLADQQENTGAFSIELMGLTDSVTVSSDSAVGDVIGFTDSVIAEAIAAPVFVEALASLDAAQVAATYDQDLDENFSLEDPFTQEGGGTAVQVARPDVTISAGSWQVVGAASLDDALDEPVVDDDDYALSSTNPATPDIMEVRLSGLLDPDTSAGHKIRYRFKRAGADSRNLTVRLMNGNTIIASWTHNDVSDTIQQVEQTLTGPEADAIIDYNDLRLRYEVV